MTGSNDVSESQRLLQINDVEKGKYNNMEIEESIAEMEILPKTKTQILIRLFISSYPIALALVFELLGSFVCLFFAGRVDSSIAPSIIFAGVSLASMFANVSCFSIQEGMSSAIETLGSQANGSKDFEAVGNVLNRCIVILTLITCPLLITWVYVDDVFRYLGVAEEICFVIEKYLQVRMVGVPFDIIGISYDKYLMSIGVMDPSMYSAILFNIFLTFFCFIFISVYDLHFSFIAWAYVIATALRAFTEIAFSWNTIEVQRTIRMPNYKIFEDWVVFLKLGIPGCVMVCSEWWAFEILTVFASILGANAVDAQTIIFQLSVLVFMFPYGVSVATASIVGNALGANEIDLAKQTGTMALLFIFAINICLAIGIIEGGPYFISTLTTDPGVIKTTSELLPFLSLFILLDGLQGVASGIMRGAGRQNLGAILGFFTYYAVGLPMAWILTFKFQLGVKGLMMGISFGTVIQSSVLLSVIFFYSSYVYEPIKH